MSNPHPASDPAVISGSVPQSSVLDVRPSSDRSIALLLALLLFGIYLFSFNGRITSSDGLSMFAVTDSFIKRGDFSTDQMWTFFGTKTIPAPAGEVYSKYGYGTSLFAAPLYALALFFQFGGLTQATLLSSALAIALTAALLYLAARRLSPRCNQRISPSVLSPLILALLFGLATPAWVYAQEFWSEPFATLTLFAAFYFLLCYRAKAKIRDAAIAGIWLGLALAVRTTNLFLIPLYLLYAFLPPLSLQNLSLRGASQCNHRMRQKQSLRGEDKNLVKLETRAILAFLIPVILFTLSIFLYNFIRFHNPLTTGYRPDEDFSNNLLLGAYGLLFSPGKGIFVYAPFLAALPFGISQFLKHQKRELAFISILFAFYLILFSAWYYWWGGTNWAARFLVPTLPFLVLLCAPLVQCVLARPLTSRLALFGLRLVLLVLVVLSVINELAGVAVNSLTYRLHVVPLSANPDWDSIFTPALSPLIGHWQTLQAKNLDVAWLRVTPDTIQIDWLVVGLTLFFILACFILLLRALFHLQIRPQLYALVIIFAVLVVFISLQRYANDPRNGGNDGYASLLQTLQTNSRADDVLVLNDDAYARYFLNTNRAPLRWYGLSRDPARWDNTTRDLFSTKLASYPRVWFAYDTQVDAPNPMRDWFESNLNQTQRFDFADGVTLVSYTPR